MSLFHPLVNVVKGRVHPASMTHPIRLKPILNCAPRTQPRNHFVVLFIRTNIEVKMKLGMTNFEQEVRRLPIRMLALTERVHDMFPKGINNPSLNRGQIFDTLP